MGQSVGSDARGRDGDTQEAAGHQAGAGPGAFMTHLAVQEADDDGQTSYWGEHVTDEYWA
jgi:hypothetical protein